MLGFGYEEALGFAVDSCVADKDGLSAALALRRLAHALSRDGLTLMDRLDRARRTASAFTPPSQLSIRAEGAAGTCRRSRGAVERAAARAADVDSGSSPSARSSTSAEGWRGLAPTDGVWLLVLGEKGRVVVRPVGHRSQGEGLPRDDARRSDGTLARPARSARRVARRRAQRPGRAPALSSQRSAAYPGLITVLIIVESLVELVESALRGVEGQPLHVVQVPAETLRARRRTRRSA